jgi:hypothetical protein
VALTWDGRANGGQVVSAGRYRVHVEAQNQLGTAVLEAQVTVRRKR